MKSSADLINRFAESASCDRLVGPNLLEQALCRLPLTGDARRHFDQIEQGLRGGSLPLKPLLFIGPVGVGKTRTAEELAERVRPTLGFVGRYSPVELGSVGDYYEPTEISKELLVDWTKKIREDSGFLNGGRLLIFNDIEKIGRASSAAAKALRAFLDAVVRRNQKLLASGGSRSDWWLTILTTNVEDEKELHQLIGDDGRAVIDRCVKYYFRAATELEVVSLLQHESLARFDLRKEAIAGVAAECGGSFRRAINGVVRLHIGAVAGGENGAIDHLHEGLQVLVRQFGLAIHAINQLKAEAERTDAAAIRELVELESGLVDCQQWVADIAARKQLRDGKDGWQRELKEFSMRLSPRHSTGALMRKFQNTVRDAKWASDAAKKKHAKARREREMEEMSARQMDLDSLGNSG